MLKHVDIYITHTIKGFVSDSAQYAYALMYKGEPRYGYGEVTKRITQNSLVLMVMGEAMGRMRCSCEITIYMNSPYIANAFCNGWTETWKKNGYEKAGGGKITDSARWEELMEKCAGHIIKVEYSERHELTGLLETGIRRGGIFEL
ncbi:MAG: hypothetical protein K2G55_16685 [Lachnospiraceae bacterium]|nr:hypothetical protein [Lachnospiraceae bacterium]MDE7201514.1 hypothetical protein [Lachnospiraceae bacterium]